MLEQVGRTEIRRAAEADLERIETLLGDAQLPLEGAPRPIPCRLRAWRALARAIVGAVALEMYPDSALLRSLVVDPAAQGQGLGARLTRAAVEEASRRGVHAIYLLTTTAEHFFPRFGFVAVDRHSVPPSIQGSIEFQSACPASAIAMRR